MLISFIIEVNEGRREAGEEVTGQWSFGNWGILRIGEWEMRSVPLICANLTLIAWLDGLGSG